MKKYVPEAGDLVWIDFSPQAGHEQAGHRPALVLSPASYNGKLGLAVVCPITSQAKNFPFEVLLPSHAKVRGVVLSDQVTCVDWRDRGATHAGAVAASVMEEVRENIAELLRI
jgi:mRNA interferase MazF